MSSAASSSAERRKYERIKLFLPGQLFNPINEQSAECKVLNLSAGGAAVQCDTQFPAGVSLVLYIENFGRFEGTTIVHKNGQMALEFVIGENKRGRLKEMIKTFAAGSLSHKPERAPCLVSGSITRENGEQIACDVLDISLDGVSLRTRFRPPVGEILNLGRARGRVVRHLIEGIAVQYVKEVGRAA